jgi:hypothetical protein
MGNPQPPEDHEEPFDLFGQDTSPPELTRDMLPDTPASDFCFNVAERFGTTTELAMMAYLGVCGTVIDDGIRVERKAGHLERAQVNMVGIGAISAGKTPQAKPFINVRREIEAAEVDRYHRRKMVYDFGKAVYDKRKNALINELAKKPPGTENPMGDSFLGPEPTPAPEAIHR